MDIYFLQAYQWPVNYVAPHKWKILIIGTKLAIFQWNESTLIPFQRSQYEGYFFTKSLANILDFAVIFRLM